MKYQIKEYEITEFYAPDEDVANHNQKIIKTRKDHQCCNCQSKIEKGNNVLVETGFLDGKPCRSYTCIDCCDKWLDEINGGGDSEHGQD